MSRVVHWQQNHSIARYPTHILRQLVLPPGAEVAILHLQILSDSDRFANLVQWFSVAAGLCGVSLIAKELRAVQHVVYVVHGFLDIDVNDPLHDRARDISSLRERNV